jgi:mRNA-degrading endonuclease toxin of MazEF toxin-antitoxin module
VNIAERVGMEHSPGAKVRMPGRNSGRNRGGRSQTPVRGEVWWAEGLKCGDGCRKSRPVIVLGCDGDGVTCFICTSQGTSGNRTHRILDPDRAGLDRETNAVVAAVRVDRSSLARRIGTLSEEDRGCLGI